MKFIEQKNKVLEKVPFPLVMDDIINQLAEVIYHSYFNKHPHELQKIMVYAKGNEDLFKAA